MSGESESESESQIRILSAAQVEQCLNMTDTIDLVRGAMQQVSRGQCEMPLRFIVPVGGGNMMGVMPGAMQEPACYGTKLLSLYPGNPALGLSSHLGGMMVFDAEFGEPVGLVNAGALTALRTAAASAVATDALARADANHLCLIGTGEQAWSHLEAISAIRPINRLTIAGRTLESVDRFADQASRAYSSLFFVATDDVEKAVADADVICTVTSASEPVLYGDWLPDGAHVNAVGASIPTKKEIDVSVVQRSRTFFDYLPSIMAQAGEIIEGLKSGTLTEQHLLAEIGAVLNGDADGRLQDSDVTLYRSMGVAAQDLICAHHVLQVAAQKDIGTIAPF